MFENKLFNEFESSWEKIKYYNIIYNERNKYRIYNIYNWPVYNIHFKNDIFYFKNSLNLTQNFYDNLIQFSC